MRTLDGGVHIRKTYKDLERPVTTVGGQEGGGLPLLCSGVNRFHVCLHFIYCSTCCCRHSGHEALWTVTTLF